MAVPRGEGETGSGDWRAVLGKGFEWGYCGSCSISANTYLPQLVCGFVVFSLLTYFFLCLFYLN